MIRGPVGPRRSLPGLLVLSWATLTFLVILACRREELSSRWLRAERRLVDSGADARGRPPTAVTGDEMRHVLAAPPFARLLRASGVVVPPDGRLTLEAPLPPPLAAAQRLVVLVRHQRDGAWSDQPPRIVEVEEVAHAGARPATRVALELGREAAGAAVEVVANAYALAAGPPPAHASAPITVPDGARLELGIAILEAAWEEGPVAFRVEACPEGTAPCTAVFQEILDPGLASGRGWQDRAVDLAPLAGRRVVLRFTTHPLEDGADGPGAFSLPLWANPTLYVPAPRPVSQKAATNVILLSIDTLRADHLPSYGYPLDTAPFLRERFEKEGTVFDHLVAAAATTGPSHMTLFTGLQPSLHGVRSGRDQPPPQAVTLAELLRAAGLDTAAYTENGRLNAHQGFARGFDLYRENKSPDVGKPLGQVDATFAQAREWLRRHRDRRFFLFLHTYQVHAPYAPPKRYAHLFPEPPPGRPPDPRLRPDQDPALYDREIRYVDDELRGLWATLEELGLAERTVVILLSDHGEEFLEHGFVGHGPTLFQEVLHVPFMVAGPGVPRGRRVTVPVAHADLMPTILELAGVRAPPPVPRELAGAAGRSLAPFLRTQASAAATELERALARRPLFSETWHRHGRAAGRRSVQVPQPTYAVRSGSRKLIRRPRGDGVEYLFFDLEQDPGELQDLYPHNSEAAADLRRLLDAYPDRMAAARAAWGEAPPEPDLPPDPEREAKLRALGYID